MNPHFQPRPRLSRFSPAGGGPPPARFVIRDGQSAPPRGWAPGLPPAGGRLQTPWGPGAPRARGHLQNPTPYRGHRGSDRGAGASELPRQSYDTGYEDEIEKLLKTPPGTDNSTEKIATKTPVSATITVTAVSKAETPTTKSSVSQFDQKPQTATTKPPKVVTEPHVSQTFQKAFEPQTASPKSQKVSTEPCVSQSFPKAFEPPTVSPKSQKVVDEPRVSQSFQKAFEPQTATPKSQKVAVESRVSQSFPKVFEPQTASTKSQKVAVEPCVSQSFQKAFEPQTATTKSPKLAVESRLSPSFPKVLEPQTASTKSQKVAVEPRVSQSFQKAFEPQMATTKSQKVAVEPRVSQSFQKAFQPQTASPKPPKVATEPRVSQSFQKAFEPPAPTASPKFQKVAVEPRASPSFQKAFKPQNVSTAHQGIASQHWNDSYESGIGNQRTTSYDQHSGKGGDNRSQYSTETDRYYQTGRNTNPNFHPWHRGGDDAQRSPWGQQRQQPYPSDTRHQYQPNVQQYGRGSNQQYGHGAYQQDEQKRDNVNLVNMDIDEEEDQSSFCQYCNISFDNEDLLTKHTQGMLHKRKVNEAEKQQKTRQDEEDEDDDEDTSYCRYCKQSFTNTDTYYKHTRGMLHVQKLMEAESQKPRDSRDGNQSGPFETVETKCAFEETRGILMYTRPPPKPQDDENWMVMDDEDTKKVPLEERDLKPEDIGSKGSSVFVCDICNVTCTGAVTMTMHLDGMKHKIKAEKVREGTLEKPTPTRPEQETNTCEVDIEPLCAKAMAKSPTPLIGLQYITEFQKDDTLPRYVCNLCEAKCDGNTVMSHISGIKHRMKYFKVHHPTIYNHLASYNNMKKKSEMNSNAEQFAEEVSEKENHMYKVKVKVEINKSTTAAAEVLLKRSGIHISSVTDYIQDRHLKSPLPEEDNSYYPHTTKRPGARPTERENLLGCKRFKGDYDEGDKESPHPPRFPPKPYGRERSDLPERLKRLSEERFDDRMEGRVSPHTRGPKTPRDPYDDHAAPPQRGRDPYDDHSAPPPGGRDPYDDHSAPPPRGRDPYDDHSAPPPRGRNPYDDDDDDDDDPYQRPKVKGYGEGRNKPTDWENRYVFDYGSQDTRPVAKEVFEYGNTAQMSVAKQVFEYGSGKTIAAMQDPREITAQRPYDHGQGHHTDDSKGEGHSISPPLSEEQREADENERLFREFMEWKKRQKTGRQTTSTPSMPVSTSQAPGAVSASKQPAVNPHQPVTNPPAINPQQLVTNPPAVNPQQPVANPPAVNPQQPAANQQAPPQKDDVKEDKSNNVAEMLGALSQTLITNEDEAAMALQVSNALTQALLQFRLMNVPQQLVSTSQDNAQGKAIMEQQRMITQLTNVHQQTSSLQEKGQSSQAKGQKPPTKDKNTEEVESSKTSEKKKSATQQREEAGYSLPSVSLPSHPVSQQPVTVSEQPVGFTRQPAIPPQPSGIPPVAAIPQQTAGIPPQPSGFPPVAGIPRHPAGFPQQPAGVPRQPAGVPRQPTGVPRHPAGFPRQPAGVPRQPAGVPRQPAGFPRQPAGIPPQTVGMPLPPTGIPPHSAGMPLPPTGIPPHSAGIPPQPVVPTSSTVLTGVDPPPFHQQYNPYYQYGEHPQGQMVMTPQGQRMMTSQGQIMNVPTTMSHTCTMSGVQTPSTVQTHETRTTTSTEAPKPLPLGAQPFNAYSIGTKGSQKNGTELHAWGASLIRQAQSSVPRPVQPPLPMEPPPPIPKGVSPPLPPEHKKKRRN